MVVHVSPDDGRYLEAAYIAAANPGTISSLLKERDELLEACFAMIEWDDREQDHAVDFAARMALCDLAFAKARSAIARAKGER